MTTARTIKRYANRKLYDTRDSRYVTLDHIAAMVRAGDDVRVVDNTTRADLTTATLAQIIFEEEKKTPRLSVAGLRKIIQGGMPAAAPSSAAPAAGHARFRPPPARLARAARRRRRLDGSRELDAEPRRTAHRAASRSRSPPTARTSAACRCGRRRRIGLRAVAAAAGGRELDLGGHEDAPTASA